MAWYPIYRIPDGNFRAAFLTYHSLGHLVRRNGIEDCVVSPVVGLQSYNAQVMKSYSLGCFFIVWKACVSFVQGIMLKSLVDLTSIKGLDPFRPLLGLEKRTVLFP